jgi:hypothetical protein
MSCIRQLRDRIIELSPTAHKELFKIVQVHNVQWTPNMNGVFFYLSNQNESFIQDVQDFVDYCMRSKKDLDEHERYMQTCLYMANNSKSSNHMNANTAITENVQVNDDIFDLINGIEDELSPFVVALFEEKKPFNASSLLKFSNSRKRFYRKVASTSHTNELKIETVESLSSSSE